MADLIVADSGPIISFARAEKLHLIQQVCDEIIVPPTVYDEIVVKGQGKPGAEEVKKASWITVQAPKNGIEVRELEKQFDRGECEAIVLAQELKAILLADERVVIEEARERNIEIVSTHLILVEAKQRNLIKSVRQELNDLVASGFRTTSELIKKTLQKAGEQEFL